MFVIEDVKASSQSPTPLTIRIDSVGQFWWNTKRVSPKNLPELIPSVENMPDSLGYNLDFKVLHNVILNFKKNRDRIYIQIIVYPKSHYMNLDNLLTLINIVKSDYEKLNKSNDREKNKIHIFLQKWADSDNKKINAAIKDKNIKRLLPINIPEENTFQYKYDNGYWDENEFEFYPRVTMPKVLPTEKEKID